MRISMPTDISKNEKNPWKMMELSDILKVNQQVQISDIYFVWW